MAKGCKHSSWTSFLSVLLPLLISCLGTGATHAQSWTDLDEDEMYTARHECSFVQAGDKFYLMGGRENGRTIDVYDYSADTWSALPDSSPVEFNHFQATEYQGLIWVIGAFRDNAFPTEQPEENIWIFNPATEEWIQGPLIPENRRRGSTGLSVYNDKFYISGGNTIGHDGGYVAWFDEYNPATGTWTPLADAPRPRDHFHSVIIGNRLYLAGGRLSGGPGGVFAPTIPQVDVYDFIAAAWSTLPSPQNLPTPRGGASAVNFNDQLYVIGGEVQNQVVYGVNTDDALKITEAFDPVSMSWARLPDLNFERHGTQAIVSGTGIFTLAGSPSRGGGNQRNMEFFGSNSPVGSPAVASILSAPSSVVFEDGETKNINLQLSAGNVGELIRSITISGADASDFTINSGLPQIALIGPGGSREINITFQSSGGGDRNALMTIAYGADSTLEVILSNNTQVIEVTDPGDQFNTEGQMVNLAIQAVGVTNPTYSATGLPPDLSINPVTGLITGTISDGSGNGSAFREADGLVIVEAESGTLVPSWGITTAGGETGIMAGSDQFNNQNGGTISYQLQISTPGVYRFNWNNFYSGMSSTDQNDNWLRFPNNADVWFFGYQGVPPSEAFLIDNLQGAQSDIVFPRGSGRESANTTPEGVGSNGYLKIYRSGGTSETYDWQARTSDNEPHDVYVWFANPGTYTMEISERSLGHAIDRVALYKVDGPDYSDAQLSSFPESPTTGDGIGAAANSPYQVTVTVTGDNAGSGSTQFSWTIGAAGLVQSVPQADPLTGESPLVVDFTGSNSTDDLGVTQYAWDFDDGTPDSGEADPTHTFQLPGTYEVSLTVQDADGNSSTNSISINVIAPANEPPVAGITATQLSGMAPFEVPFSSDSSSDDEGIVSYSWDFGDGGSSNVSDPIHIFDAPGEYEVLLTVTDAGGLMDTDMVTITVEEAPVNEPPVAIAEATAVSGTAPLEVTFSGINSTDDLGIEMYQWDFKDGGASGETDPIHIFNSAGIYEVELTVVDAGGLSNATTITITVEADPLNEPPAALAEAFPLTGTAPLEVLFTGSNSTDDFGISNYLWDFKDGDINSVDADPVHTFNTPGMYEVELTVTDGDGLTNTASVSITVYEPAGNQPPVAIAQAIPATGTAPLEVNFTGSASTDDDGVTRYEWDFKDGSPLVTEADPVHIFQNDGTYAVQLTVTDAEGSMDTAEITIVVGYSADTPPTAVIEATPSSGTAPLEVTFIGRNSFDDFGIVNYAWNFGDGALSQTEDPVHTFTEVGIYTVVLSVTDASGLTNSATIVIVVDNNTEGDLRGMILKNPAYDGVATIQIINQPSDVVVMEIYVHDSSGRLMRSFKADEVAISSGIYEIPVAALRDGLYFIGLEMDQGDNLLLKLLVVNMQ